MEIWKKAIEPLIDNVVVNEKMVCFFIGDGRSISLSLSLFDELADGEHDAIRDCQIIDDAQAVYWPQYNKTICLSEVLED